MDRPPSATVVVPVRNGERVVGAALGALESQVTAVGAEIVVVDDASTDATARVVSAWAARHPEVALRLVRRTRRGGPNSSRNAGIATARSDLICLTDGDDVTAPGWLAAMVAHTDDRAISCGTLVDIGRPRIPVVPETPPTLWSVPFAFGGNMAFTRSTYERAGGFEELGVVAGATEWDFCRRAGLAGIPVAVVPGAVVRYRQPAGPWGKFRRQFVRERGACLLFRALGPDVVPTRRFAEWRHDWRGVRAALVSGGPDASHQAAVRIGCIVGRATWNARYRTSFW